MQIQREIWTEQGASEEVEKSYHHMSELSNGSEEKTLLKSHTRRVRVWDCKVRVGDQLKIYHAKLLEEPQNQEVLVN